MRISPSDFLLLNEIMGGLLYMSFSSGFSWIKCHFLIKMFLRFSKGRIFFQTSLFFCKTNLCLVNLTSEVIFFYEIVRVTSSAKSFFEVVDVLREEFSWGVSFEKSKGFALYETFSDLWGLQKEKCVYWKVSVGLKCVQISSIPWLWNLSPL